jgi:hypothetical protein
MPRTVPMTLLEAVTQLVERLSDNGIRAAVDTRDLNPPAVLVIPPDMAWRFARDTWDATWRLLLVVPNTGSGQDLVALDALIGQVRDALGGAPTTGVARTVSIDGAHDPLPAYELSWTS